METQQQVTMAMAMAMMLEVDGDGRGPDQLEEDLVVGGIQVQLEEELWCQGQLQE